MMIGGSYVGHRAWGWPRLRHYSLLVGVASSSLLPFLRFEGGASMLFFFVAPWLTPELRVRGRSNLVMLAPCNTLHVG